MTKPKFKNKQMKYNALEDRTILEVRFNSKEDT